MRHGGQYDPELLQRLTLSGLRLARLGAGLARCTALRVLDLARNKLQHLDGVEVCASLERLLVARNELTRFGFVAGLAKLDHLDARANALQDVDAVAADLRPCAAPPRSSCGATTGRTRTPAARLRATPRRCAGRCRRCGSSTARPRPRGRGRDRARRDRRPRPSTRRRRRPTTGSATADDAAAPGSAPGRRTRPRRASGRTRTGPRGDGPRRRNRQGGAWAAARVS